MSDLRAVLGGRIRELRASAGLSQERLAAVVGLTRASIANMEAGRQEPSASHLVGLAVALGVTVDELVQSTPDLQRVGDLELRVARMEDQVRRLVHALNAAGGALQAFDLAVQTTRARPLDTANTEEA